MRLLKQTRSLKQRSPSGVVISMTMVGTAVSPTQRRWATTGTAMFEERERFTDAMLRCGVEGRREVRVEIELR